MRVLVDRLPALLLMSLAVGGSAAVAQAQQRPRHGSSQALWSLFELACSDRGAAVDDASAPPFSDFFGYALPTTQRPLPSPEVLQKLAERMRESRAGDRRLDDAAVPSGMVFFGQFIDHDVTLEAVSRLGQVSDPAEIENLRSPSLDLDSLYLDGPEGSPFLYDQDQHGHFLIGTSENPLDLPRNEQGVALIGDPRNDENTIVSQLHLLFLRFHNAVMTDVESGVLDGFRLETDRSDFEFAQRIVRWHYQWIVRNEFLPAVVRKDVLQAVSKGLGDGSWCSTGRIPSLPIEFSAAAYRFGHSQVRGRLRVGRRAPLLDLFPLPGSDPAEALGSFAPVDPEHVVDWSLFFRSTVAHPQPARRLDTFLADQLFALPFVGAGDEASLAARNLSRGAQTFELATGEEAYAFLNEHAGPLGPPPATHPAIEELGLSGTPLWFYCLWEAEAGNGKLGDVGGRIVALTLLRMLSSDPASFMPIETMHRVQNAKDIVDARARLKNAKRPHQANWKQLPSGVLDKAWRPFLGLDGKFTLASLVRYVEATEGR